MIGTCGRNRSAIFRAVAPFRPSTVLLSPVARTVRTMGLSRKVVRIALTTRAAGVNDRIALPGMPLWVVTWTVRDRLGREQVREAPHVSEGGAHRMVDNLMKELAPGLSPQDVFTDQPPEGPPSRAAPSEERAST